MPHHAQTTKGSFHLSKQGSKQQGFTLVEIAIVLVIVGLLLGAVLKGQELIFNTKIKSTFNLSREVSAALYAYQDRYRMVPGDDNKATTRFPISTPAVVNGDGNGTIAVSTSCTVATPTSRSENCSALHHMRAAGFLSGSGAEALRTPFGSLAYPGGSLYFYPNSGYGPALGYYSTGLTYKIMSSIDSSFDDGDPTTGVIRCRSTTAYNMSTPDANMPSYCSATL